MYSMFQLMSGQPGGNRGGRGGRSASDNSPGGDQQGGPQGGRQGGRQGGQQRAPQGGPGGPGGPQGGPGGPGAGQPPGGDDEILGYTQDRLIDFAKFGVIIYGIVGLGMYLTYFISMLLGDEDNTSLLSVPGEDELFFAATSVSTTVIFLTTILAVGLAIYFYKDADVEGPSYTPPVVAAVAGIVVVSIVLMLLALIFEPDGFDIGLGAEIVPFIGVWIGTAISAALTGFVLDEYWEV